MYYKKYINPSIKYISIYLFISLLITFILTYFYLRKIESCDCILGKNYENGTYNVNIKNLEYIQIALIIIVVVDHMFILNDHIDKLGIFKILLLFIILVLYGGFIYYIYYFSKNINNPNCECGKTWERYVLYKQFLIYIGIISIIIIALIFNIEHDLLDHLYEFSSMKHVYYLFKSIFK